MLVLLVFFLEIFQDPLASFGCALVSSILQEKTLKYLNKWQIYKERIMGSDKQNPGLLETLKMETVRTIFTHTYPYPHEHSRHAVIAVFIGCLFFISSDNMHTLVQKLDSNFKWWSMYACLLGFFYFFSSPFIGKTIKPSYSNFSRWYVSNLNWFHQFLFLYTNSEKKVMRLE